MTRSSPDLFQSSSGRYAHLSRPQDQFYDDSPGQWRPAGLLHARTLLFVAVALLVGAGLLTVAPDLSASAGEATLSLSAEAGHFGTPDDGLLAGDSSPLAPSLAEVPEATTEQTLDAVAEISPVFTREVQHWAPKIGEWSQQYNLDPDIIATIMQIESCGDPGAASYAGAQGLFQVMPFHFDPGEDQLDPDTNARRGMAFYNRQLEYTDWDIYLSFAGYNGGYAASGSSYSYWANETQRYHTWAKGIYDDAKAGLTESPTLQQWLAAGGDGGCQRAAQRLGI